MAGYENTDYANKAMCLLDDAENCLTDSHGETSAKLVPIYHSRGQGALPYEEGPCLRREHIRILWMQVLYSLVASCQDLCPIFAVAPSPGLGGEDASHPALTAGSTGPNIATVGDMGNPVQSYLAIT